MIALITLIAFLATPGAPRYALAQDEDPPEEQETEGDAQPPAQARPRLFITAADPSTAPQVTLRAYGLDHNGSPLNLAAEQLVVRHEGENAEPTVAGSIDVGTFTVFLIDAPPGVVDQIPAIQQVLEQYAAPDAMREQMDQLAIYRVGDEGADEALPPTTFYNSVRNFFSGGFEPQGGPTALYDSMVDILNSMDQIRPEASLAPALVVFSDGTDAVSTQFEAGEVAARAIELGIPIHTVWLENADLTVGQEAGRNYLIQLASDAYGLSARLDQPETVAPILERISAFRAQQLVRYTPPTLTGGPATVELALVNDPLARDETQVTINAASPTVSLVVPPDSRTIQLPDLDDPVRLLLGAEVGWLDGSQRAVQQARLLVNGQFVQDVPPNSLTQFTAEIGNFIYGDNSLQLAITDDQGFQAASPDLVLTVVEGETQIPEALQPAPGFNRLLLPVCAGIALFALLGVIGFYLLQGRRLPGLPSRRRRDRDSVTIDEGDYAVPPPVIYGEGAPYEGPPYEGAPQYAEPVARQAATPAAGGAPAQAYLEVVETLTEMPSHIPLRSEEVRLGRSPALADVAFEQDITVSRLHASILWDGHSYRLYDDDSTSGTWVNDQEVPDYGAQLFDGDDIFLGKVRLRFRQR